MIIFLTGTNDFAMRSSVRQLAQDFLSKYGVHAVEYVDGEALDAAVLPELLQGASLFADQRMVVLRDASKNKPLWDALDDWAEKVPAEVTLVLRESAPDKRTRTYKQLQKHGQLRDFADLNEHELAKWASLAAKQQGSELDAKAAAYLVRQVGTNQWQLFTELQKLSGAAPRITTELIDQLVEPNPQASAFDLLDSVLAGKAAKAADLLSRLKTVEDPYKLFGLLVSQVQTLALVVSAPGKPADTVAKECGVHPFVVRKMQPLARGIGYTDLQQIIAAVAQTDNAMKSSAIDPWTLLEQCLNKIAAQV